MPRVSLLVVCAVEPPSLARFEVALSWIFVAADAATERSQGGAVNGANKPLETLGRRIRG